MLAKGDRHYMSINAKNIHYLLIYLIYIKN